MNSMHSVTKNKFCNDCGDGLIVGVNWTTNYKNLYKYICSGCLSLRNKKYHRLNSDRINKNTRTNYDNTRELHGHLPMSENKECAAYLGVHVAERLLKKTFKDIIRMPFGNPGYDYICDKGYKIDVKISQIRITPSNTEKFSFGISKNTIADYFALIAIDNRDGLNIMYYWLIPGNVLNSKTGACISMSTINKWDEYLKPIDKMIKCCNEMKGDKL